MADEKTRADVAVKASWLQRQLVGTAMSAGLGAAGGAVWHLIKKRPLINGIKGGTIVGVIGSIGLAGSFYDSVFAEKPQTFADLINEERTKADTVGAQR